MNLSSRFYHLITEASQLESLTVWEVRQEWKNERMTAETLCWFRGQDDWKPIWQFINISVNKSGGWNSERMRPFLDDADGQWSFTLAHKEWIETWRWAYLKDVLEGSGSVVLGRLLDGAASDEIRWLADLAPPIYRSEVISRNRNN